jgi:hypothetical protein
MQSVPKSRWLIGWAAFLTLALLGCDAAKASEFELVYNAILNEGGTPATLNGAPLPAGTPLTITSEFDTSSADQWNTGAYIYTALSPTFFLGTPAGRYEVIWPALSILLSDPSWATVGGPSPYSAGFYNVGASPGSLNSVFGSSTAVFQAADPSPSRFYDYQYGFDFTGPGPVGLLTVLLDAGSLAIYTNSVSNVTAAIFPVPELPTWGLALVGFASLAGLAHVRGRASAHPSSG